MNTEITTRSQAKAAGIADAEVALRKCKCEQDVWRIARRNNPGLDIGLAEAWATAFWGVITEKWTENTPTTRETR